MLAHFDETHQRVVDSHTHWQEEGASGGKFAESPQFLVLTDTSMIPLGSFLEVFLVFRHLLSIRE